MSFIFVYISECRFSTVRLVDTLQKQATTSNPPLRLTSWCQSIALTKLYSTTESTKNLDAATKASETETSSNLDDFRSREEQREEEFAKQTEDPHTQDEEKIKAVRHQILNASLPFVSTHGWTREAISKGAESQGFPGVAHGMFPNGGVELIQHFYQQCNQSLVQQLRDNIAAAKDAKPQPIVEFVTNALRLRLQMIEPYQSHWPQALGIMSLPQNVPTSLAQLLTLIDDICYFAGDRSVDVRTYYHSVFLLIYFIMHLVQLVHASYWSCNYIQND